MDFIFNASLNTTAIVMNPQTFFAAIILSVNNKIENKMHQSDLEYFQVVICKLAGLTCKHWPKNAKMPLECCDIPRLFPREIKQKESILKGTNFFQKNMIFYLLSVYFKLCSKQFFNI